MLAIDGAIRLVGALVLWGIGVNNAGAYGMCIALSPFVAVAVLPQTSGAPAAGPTRALLGALERARLAARRLSADAGARLLVAARHQRGQGTGKEQALIVAGFTSAFFIARIPPLLFQAVQGTLLPKLAGLAGAGRHDDFRTGLKQLLVIVIGIAAFGTVAAYTIGVPIGKILFPPFDIDPGDLALLAAGSGMFIISLTVAQALIALHGHKAVAFAWAVGVVGFFIGAVPISDLELRVEIGFLLGTSLTTLVMGIALYAAMRGERSRDHRAADHPARAGTARALAARGGSAGPISARLVSRRRQS